LTGNCARTNDQLVTTTNVGILAAIVGVVELATYLKALQSPNGKFIRHMNAVTIITLILFRCDYYCFLPSVAAFEFTRVAMHVLPQKLSVFRIAIFAGVFCAAVTSLDAEHARIVVPPFGAPIFQHLARNSGIIFSGTVTSISKIETGSQNNVGTVQVTFHVEQALRGARKGQTLVIREWAGLWNSGDRSGERVALFLFNPGKLGLTSPVGGGARKISGRFPRPYFIESKTCGGDFCRSRTCRSMAGQN
jgi:hypothetical protein